MTLPLFYADEGLDLTGESVTLTGSTAHHAATVLRMLPGQRLLLSDGQGMTVSAVIKGEQGSGKNINLELVIEDRFTEELRRPALHLVQALAKNDRDLQAIETATEYGVDVVSPFQAERSVVRWKGERGQKSWQKWKNLLDKSSQQARRSLITDLTNIVTASDIAAWCEKEDVLVVIMDEHGHQDMHQLVAALGGIEELTKFERIVIVIGPEGGLSEQEKQLWYDAGAVGIKLGHIIMRASSAGPAALATLNLLLKRW